MRRIELHPLPSEREWIAKRVSGRFPKGTHWRPRKPHWDKSWLENEYVIKGKSTTQIAAEIGCHPNNILFWLDKYNIPRRAMSQIRAERYWGAHGSANGMFGRTGKRNPNYKDGSCPERQLLYIKKFARKFLQSVYRRDNFHCVRCGAPNTGPRSIHAHHIRPWAGNPKLRFELTNVITLCRKCHSWIHSLKNIHREYLA